MWERRPEARECVWENVKENVRAGGRKERERDRTGSVYSMTILYIVLATFWMRKRLRLRKSNKESLQAHKQSYSLLRCKISSRIFLLWIFPVAPLGSGLWRMKICCSFGVLKLASSPLIKQSEDFGYDYNNLCVSKQFFRWHVMSRLWPHHQSHHFTLILVQCTEKAFKWCKFYQARIWKRKYSAFHHCGMPVEKGFYLNTRYVFPSPDDDVFRSINNMHVVMFIQKCDIAC